MSEPSEQSVTPPKRTRVARGENRATRKRAEQPAKPPEQIAADPPEAVEAPATIQCASPSEATPHAHKTSELSSDLETNSAPAKSAPPFTQILKKSTAESWELAVSSTEKEAQDPGNARQVLDGSLLGTCIVFFASMLSVQQMDTPLTVAAVAFAVAIPPLACGFFLASLKITDKIKSIPGWRLLGAVTIAAWVIEGLAAGAVLVGVFCVILHVSHLASTAFIWAIIAYCQHQFAFGSSQFVVNPW